MFKKLSECLGDFKICTSEKKLGDLGYRPNLPGYRYLINFEVPGHMTWLFLNRFFIVTELS